MTQPWSSPGSRREPQASVTLVEGSAFCISAANGDFGAGATHGLFFRDTRYLSRFEVHVNGTSPRALALDSPRPYAATFVVESVAGGGTSAGTPLVVVRHRQVGRGMREDITVWNYGDEPAYCALDLVFGADFAGLAQVKVGEPANRDVPPGQDGDALVFRSSRGALRRGVRVVLEPPAKISGDTASYEVIVAARGRWSVCIEARAVIDAVEVRPLSPCGSARGNAESVARRHDWQADLPRISTDSPALSAAMARSLDDLGALRMLDPTSPGLAVPAAGAPWHLTLFGRDSLLTSLMALVVDPDLALGTLRTLARFQGVNNDARTEEAPGKILHEVRLAGAPELSLAGGEALFGSVDSTPLFVMLLGELRRWGLASEAVDALLPAADRALDWITTQGDMDGDGFVEYQRVSDRGRVNQSWRDSPEAVRFADGTQPRGPVATCEVQGYTYAAFLARAFFAEEVGDADLADSYRARARTLKERFNQAFWLPGGEYFAAGLDGEKRPIDSMASTMGHCLWTGIVDEERAAKVAARLMSPEMYSGWGVRTLATTMAGYHPLGYHTGSVWPHDNALCAAGLMRYGFVDEAHRVITDMLEASGHLDHQLPELISGLARDEVDFPVVHPWACRPKAWAAAAPLMFMRTLLRLDPWVPRKKVWLSPDLGPGMTRLSIDRMPLAGRVTLVVDSGSVTVEGLPADVELVTVPRRPLTA